MLSNKNFVVFDLYVLSFNTRGVSLFFPRRFTLLPSRKRQRDLPKVRTYQTKWCHMPTDSKFHGNEPADSFKAGKFDEWLTIIGFSGTPSSLVCLLRHRSVTSGVITKPRLTALWQYTPQPKCSRKQSGIITREFSGDSAHSVVKDCTYTPLVQVNKTSNVRIK